MTLQPLRSQERHCVALFSVIVVTAAAPAACKPGYFGKGDAMHKHTQTCVLHPKRYEESPSPEMVACTMCWASEVFDYHLWSDVPKTLANNEMSTLRLSPEPGRVEGGNA